MTIKDYIGKYSSYILLTFSFALKSIFNLDTTKHLIIQGILLVAYLVYHLIIKKYLENINYQYDKVLFNHLIQGNLEGIKSYVKEKYKNVKALENGKLTSLIYAIAYNKLEIIEYLLSEGFDVNFQNEFSELPLIYAVHYNCEEAIDILLNYKPDLELKSSKLKTSAIETAVYRNKPKIVEKLLRHGAKFSLESYTKSSKKYTKINLLLLVGGEITKWKDVKPSVKRIFLKEIIFQKKKNLFNIHDKAIKKELDLPLFNDPRNYFIENLLSS